MKRDRQIIFHRIGRDTVLDGSLHFKGRLDVEGRINGSIISDDPRHSTVRILAAGMVDGEIRAANIQVAGTVNGPVRAARRLQVQATARLNGDVVYRDLQLEHGAQLKGSLKCTESDEPALKLNAVGRKY
ncbi:MAG: polymer-forming cytoskeletal protein [Lautropia sp.]|nr:polymer-forming cytoskeletal protein [Lautropia sp.]